MINVYFNISDEVLNILKELKSSFEPDENYARFMEFYAEMKRLGIAKKQQYNIPLRDDYGRKQYQKLEKAIRKINGLTQ